jgi:quercetin dioxygenase-like cupin family protein
VRRGFSADAAICAAGAARATLARLCRARRLTNDGHELDGVHHAVVEGVLEYQLDGKPQATLKAGEVLFIPNGAVHAVRDVGSGSAAELATHAVENGKPLITLDPR